MAMQPQQQQQNVPPPPRHAANNPLAHLQQQVQGQHDPASGRLMPPSHQQQQQQMAAAFNPPNHTGFHGNHQYGGGGHPGNMQYGAHHHSGQQKGMMGYAQGNMAPPGGGGGMYQFNKMVPGGMYPGQAEATMYAKSQMGMMGPGGGGAGPNAAFNPGQNFMGPHMGGMNRAMMNQGQMMMGGQYGGQPGQMGSQRMMMQHSPQMNPAMMGGANMMQHPGGQSNGGPASMMMGQAVPMPGPQAHPVQQANMPMMVRGQMSPAIQMRNQTGSMGQSPMPSPMGQSGAMGQASPMGQHGSMGQASPMTSPMGQPGSVGQPSPMGGSPMGQPSPMQSPHGGQYGSSNHSNMMNPAAVYGNSGQGPQGQYMGASPVRPGMMSPTQHAMTMQQMPRQHTSPPFMAANQPPMAAQKSSQFINMAGATNHMNASGQYGPHMMSPPPSGSHAAAAAAAASQQQLPDFRTFASLAPTNFTSSKPQAMTPEMCQRGNGGMVIRQQQQQQQQQQQPQPQHHPSMSRFVSPSGQMPAEQVPHPGMGQHHGMMPQMMRSPGQRMVSPVGINSLPPQMVATNSMTTPTVTQSGPHRLQSMPAHTVTVGAHSNLNVPPNLHSNPMMEHQLHSGRHLSNHPGMANFGGPPGNMNNPGLHHGNVNAAAHTNSVWSERGPNNAPMCIPPSSPSQYHPPSLKHLHITSSPASAAMLTCTVTMATASHSSAAPCGVTSSQAGHPMSRFSAAPHPGHGASRPSSTSSTSSGPPHHHHHHQSESPAPWGSLHEHRDMDSKRHLTDNPDIVDDVRRRDLASQDGSIERHRDCDSRDSHTSSSSSMSGNTITVPFGWKRIHENGKIQYISPSGVHLPSMDHIRSYLSQDGTCKCGLECPLMVDKAFNFEPLVGSRPWCADHINLNDDLTKLCEHKRKIVAMATFQMSTLQKSLDHDGHNRAVDKNKMSHKKDGSVPRRKRGKKSSPDGIVSNFLSQRERSKEPSTPPGVGSGAGVGTAWQKYMEFFGQKSDSATNPLSLARRESDTSAGETKAAVSPDDGESSNQDAAASVKSPNAPCRSRMQQSQGDSSNNVCFPKQQSPQASPPPPNHLLPKRLHSQELMKMKMLKGMPHMGTATSISSEAETNAAGVPPELSSDITSRRHSRPQQSNPMLNAYLHQSPMNAKLAPQHCSNQSMHYNQNDCRSGPGPQPLVWPDSPPPKKKFKIKGCKKKRNNMLGKRARVRVLPEIPVKQKQSSLSNVMSSVGEAEAEEEECSAPEEEDFLHDDAVADDDAGSQGSSPASSRIDTPLSSGQCTSTPLTSPHPSCSPPPHHTPSSTPHSPSLTPCSTPHRRTPSVHTPSPPNPKSTPLTHHHSMGACNHGSSNYRAPFHLPSNDHGEMDVCTDGQTDLSNISHHKHKYCRSNKSEEVLTSSLPLLPDRHGYKLQNLFNINPGGGNFPASSLLSAAARAQLTHNEENLPQLGFQGSQSQPCLPGGVGGGPMMGFDDCDTMPRDCGGSGVLSSGIMNGHMAPLNGTGLSPNLLLQHLSNPAVNMLSMGPNAGPMNSGMGPMGGTASMLNIVNTPSVRFQKEQSPIQMVQNMITGLEATQNVITAALHSASLEDDDDDLLNQVTTKPKHRRKSSSSESSIGVATVTSGAQISTASSSGIGSSVSSCDSGGSEAGNANDTDNTISDEGKDGALLLDDMPDCNGSGVNEDVEHSNNLLPSTDMSTQTVSIATSTVLDSCNNVIQLGSSSSGSSSRHLCTEPSVNTAHISHAITSQVVSNSGTNPVVTAPSTTPVIVTTNEHPSVVATVSSVTINSGVTMVTASSCSTSPAIASMSSSLSNSTSCTDSLSNSAIPLVTSSTISAGMLPLQPSISQSMLQPPVMQFVNTFGNPLLMPSQIGLFSPDGSVINGFVTDPPVGSLASQNNAAVEQTEAADVDGAGMKVGDDDDAELGSAESSSLGSHMDASNAAEHNSTNETEECGPTTEDGIAEGVALNDNTMDSDSVPLVTESKDVACPPAESDTPQKSALDLHVQTPAQTPKQKSKNKSPKRDRSKKSSMPTIASMLQNAVSNSASSQVQVVPGIQVISSISNPSNQVVDASGQLPMNSVLMSPTSVTAAPAGAPQLVDQSAMTMVSPEQMTINMNLAAAAASAQMQMMNLLPGFGMLNPSLPGLPLQPNAALLQMMGQQQAGDGSGVVDTDPETAVLQQNLNQLQQAQLIQCNHMLQQLQQLPPNQLQMTLEQLQQNQLQLQEAIANLQQMQPQAFSQLPSTTIAQLPGVNLTGEPLSGDVTLNPLTTLGQLAPQQLMQFISLPQQQDGVAMGTEDGMTSLAQMMAQMQENLSHVCPQLQGQFTPLAGSNPTILNPLTTLPMPLAPDMMNLVTMSTVDSSGTVCDALGGKMSTSVARSTNVNTVGSHIDTSVKISSDLKSAHQNKSPSRCSPGKRKSRSPRDGSKSPKARSHAVADNDTDFLPNPAKLTKAVSAAVRGLRSRLNLFSEDLESDLPVVSSVSSIRGDSSLGNSVSNVNTITNTVAKVEPSHVSDVPADSASNQAWTTEIKTKTGKIKTEPDDKTEVSDLFSETSGTRTNISGANSPLDGGDVASTIKTEDDMEDDKSSIEKTEEESEVCDSVSLPSSTSTHTTAELTSPSTPQSGTSTPELKSEATDEAANTNECDENDDEEDGSEMDEGREDYEGSEHMLMDDEQMDEDVNEGSEHPMVNGLDHFDDDDGDDTIDVPLCADDNSPPPCDNDLPAAADARLTEELEPELSEPPSSPAVDDHSRLDENGVEVLEDEDVSHNESDESLLHNKRHLMSGDELDESLVTESSDDDQNPSEGRSSHPPRSFNIGDLVWGQIRGYPSWPGKLVHGNEVKGNHNKTEDGKLWVKWFGNHMFTQVEPGKLKTLSEGLEAHHDERQKCRKGRKINSSLESAIQEAMTELDKQSTSDNEVKVIEASGVQSTPTPKEASQQQLGSPENPAPSMQHAAQQQQPKLRQNKKTKRR